MSDARHQLVTNIFHGALGKDGADRDGYLSDACQGDDSLRAEVEELLRADAGAGSFLDEPAVAVAEDAPTLQPGTMVGRYRIEALIGAGGMGEVYRARDTELPRSVGIKVMTAQARGNASLQARFESEAHAIAALNHARICTLYDVVRHGDVQCLVMEYVEGGSLHDRLKRGPLSIGETMRYAREVAEALAVAHQRGFVHRDIKPSNIMITADGHVKVVDFGLARLTALFNSEDVTRIRHSEPGTVVGTPYYMSPEQARGALLDQRTDIFSLGVVIFECLTGRLPFDGEARDEYLQHLVSSEPHRVSEFRADAPLDLQHIIARCLERDLSKRLDSAGWLVAELDRSSGIGLPVDAGSPSVSRRFVWVSAVLALVAAAAVWYWATHRGVVPSSPNPQLRMFTTSAGAESDSRLSPDGQWVSFIGLDTSGNRQLYMQQIDAATLLPVKVPAGYLQSYAWSEDGQFFACLLWHPKEKEQEWTLEIVPTLFAPDTPVRKWTIQEFRNAALLRWIGNALYFQVSAKSDRTVSLQRFDLNRGQLELMPGPWRGKQTRAFDVRPDGRRVVWATAAGADQSDLWVSDFGSDVATPLTDPNDRSLKRFPLWKGTSNAVIYQSNLGNQADLWEIDTATRKSVPITTDPGIERPESTSLNGSVTFQLTSQKVALWNWSALGGGGRQVSDDALSDFAPTTSSDGSMLAFQRSLRAPVEGALALDTDLVLVAPARPGVRLEPTKKATGFAPALSRDGGVLAYLQRVQGAAGKFKLLATRMETGRIEEISTTILPPSNTDFPVGWSEHNFSWGSPEDLYFVDRASQPNQSRLMHYRVAENNAVPLPGTESSSRLTDVYASYDGASLAYLSYSVDASTSKPTYQLHQFDLRKGVDHVVRAYAGEDSVRLCGWLRSDAGWALTRLASRNETELTITVMVSTVNRDGTLQQEGPVDHVVPSGVLSLIASHSDLYLTRSIDGIHNLFAFGLSSHKVRRVSDNAIRDVSFGSVEPLGADDVVAVRHEKRADIYLLDARPRAGARKNPSP